MDLIQKIEKQDTVFTNNDPECLLDIVKFNYETVNEINFDDKNRFISIVNDTQIMTFNISTGAKKLHEINQLVYELISDTKISSSDGCNYQCFVIAVLRHRRSIHFFDINGDTSNLRNLNYLHPRAKCFKCHIADDCKAITLVNVKENYLLTFRPTS